MPAPQEPQQQAPMEMSSMSDTGVVTQQPEEEGSLSPQPSQAQRAYESFSFSPPDASKLPPHLAPGASESLSAALARVDPEYFKGKGKDVSGIGSSSKGKAKDTSGTGGSSKGKDAGDTGGSS
ncbi:hypothetical protein HD806DRAFT_534227 [Xylariaceae sp. AK1471]|nr:hypothetical protein HD806DRAFT_534227 [Xylariaceae sp. AK1471]